MKASDLMPKLDFTTDKNAQSVQEIAEATGMSRPSADRWVRDAFRAGVLIRKWRKVSGSNPIPVYLPVGKK